MELHTAQFLQLIFFKEPLTVARWPRNRTGTATARTLFRSRNWNRNRAALFKVPPIAEKPLLSKLATATPRTVPHSNYNRSELNRSELNRSALLLLLGVGKRVVSKRVVLADVPPERKPERGTFAKTTLLRNRPFIFQ